MIGPAANIALGDASASSPPRSGDYRSCTPTESRFAPFRRTSLSSPRLRFYFVAPGCIRFAILLCLATVAGCREREQIRAYEVDRTIEEENEKLVKAWRDKAQLAKRPPDSKPGRLLGALLVHGGETWTFKVLGDIEAVSRQAEAVRKFLESIKFADGQPSWTLPASWRTSPTANPNRYATLLLDESTPPLELAIGKLPGEQDVAANVNRWRGQVQLPPLVAETAEKSAETLTTTAGPARWVDLSGAYSPSTGMAPFAGGAMPGMTPGAAMPADHPPMNIGGPSKPATLPENLPVRFQTPADWKTITPPQFSIAAFMAELDGKQARITVSSAGGDLLANVNRWRQQIQLGPIDQEALDGAATRLKIDGRDAFYVELIGQAGSQGQQALYGIMITDSSQQSWFVKMMGDAAVAYRERERFLEFVSTFKFVK